MTRNDLKRILKQFKEGGMTDDQVIEQMSTSMHESMGFATLDHHREVRQGFPEVVLAEGKTENQVVEIARRILDHGSILLVTRASREQYEAVHHIEPEARYNELGRTITANEHLVTPRGRGTILVVSAGTSDLPVVEEAIETAKVMGNVTDCLADVGVAGIHRILGQTKKLREAAVIIVVAGMDGALPSVIGGLVDVPVIAVPTSVGYGANFNGVAPLLTMLNSCAAGVTVVNINNGFGAAFAASAINRIRE